MPLTDIDIDDEVGDICCAINSGKVSTQEEFDARVTELERLYADDPGLGDAAECVLSHWQSHTLKAENERKQFRLNAKRKAKQIAHQTKRAPKKGKKP